MFVHHRLDVKKSLREGENELVLTFWSGWNEAKKEEAANGGPVPVCMSCSVFSSLRSPDLLMGSVAKQGSARERRLV